MSYIQPQNLSLRAALISNFLVAELLASRTGDDYLLWLISPWVTNFTLSLPSNTNLATVVDSVEPRPTLFEVLRQIATNNGQVAIVVRTEYEPTKIERFIKPLRDLAVTEPNIVIRHLSNLHAKIYAGRYGALYGSPNLTESGVGHNVEFSSYASDIRSVSRLRAETKAIFDASEEFRE